MQQINTVELSKKEVINLCGGGRLGYATDVEFDVACAQVTALLIPRNTGLFAFGKTEYLHVPWRCVECIGEDAVLIRMSESEMAAAGCPVAGR